MPAGALSYRHLSPLSCAVQFNTIRQLCQSLEARGGARTGRSRRWGAGPPTHTWDVLAMRDHADRRRPSNRVVTARAGLTFAAGSEEFPPTRVHQCREHRCVAVRGSSAASVWLCRCPWTRAEACTRCHGAPCTSRDDRRRARRAAVSQAVRVHAQPAARACQLSSRPCWCSLGRGPCAASGSRP